MPLTRICTGSEQGLQSNTFFCDLSGSGSLVAWVGVERILFYFVSGCFKSGLVRGVPFKFKPGSKQLSEFPLRLDGAQGPCRRICLC